MKKEFVTSLVVFIAVAFVLSSVVIAQSGSDGRKISGETRIKTDDDKT
ncbi:hypothetical protein HYV49_01225, partial [Candidatus Pacearchaeota archaeon]|nr:hypothetical protein [Candidatus Pacearchaeota archaeon]